VPCASDLYRFDTDLDVRTPGQDGHLSSGKLDKCFMVSSGHLNITCLNLELGVLAVLDGYD
jgi:hypothetical protein